jgi:mRNA interferase MazF
MKKGDIFGANLDPTIGAEISKRRPVLIVSNNINNKFAETITVLPITSSTEKVYPFEVLLNAGDGNIKELSKIKANQIRTIDKQRLFQKIGTLSDLKLMEAERAILIHLEISSF